MISRLAFLAAISQSGWQGRFVRAQWLIATSYPTSIDRDQQTLTVTRRIRHNVLDRLPDPSRSQLFYPKG